MQIQGVTGAMSKARAKMSDAAFQDAAQVLNETLDVVREAMQKETAVLISDLIVKLKREERLSADDLKVARMWIVGDAESYTKTQQEFDYFLKRFAALETDLATYERRENSVNELIDAQGVVEEAIRTSYDIAKYLEQKERIANYEAAVKDPSKLNHKVLADLLDRKLRSEEE